MIHIVLIEPEIPPNTGNIARLCAATGSVLHLVGRLGFRITDRELKRAGLDYWSHVQLVRHPDTPKFWQEMEGKNCYLFSTRGKRLYSAIPYQDGDYLVFGCETAGLPSDILKASPERTAYIPMDGPVRSLNLSTAAGVAAFEALRQIRGDLWQAIGETR